MSQFSDEFQTYAAGNLNTVFGETLVFSHVSGGTATLTGRFYPDNTGEFAYEDGRQVAKTGRIIINPADLTEPISTNGDTVTVKGVSWDIKTILEEVPLMEMVVERRDSIFTGKGDTIER